MPTSYEGFISDIISIYIEKQPLKVLDVGVGFGKWGYLFREYGDVFKNKRYSPDDWKVIIHGIEIFEDYIHPATEYIYDEIFIGNAYDITDGLEEYEFIYAGDVIEHFEKEQAFDLLKKLQLKTQTLIVSIPLGKRWKQDSVLGNKHERHLSQWTKKDFGNNWESIIHQNSSGKLIGLFIWSS